MAHHLPVCSSFDSTANASICETTSSDTLSCGSTTGFWGFVECDLRLNLLTLAGPIRPPSPSKSREKYAERQGRCQHTQMTTAKSREHYPMQIHQAYMGF